jgi:hypothetical protein
MFKSMIMGQLCYPGGYVLKFVVVVFFSTMINFRQAGRNPQIRRNSAHIRECAGSRHFDGGIAAELTLNVS